MKKLLGPYSEFLFAVLRIVAALMFLAHGLQKFNIAMLGGFSRRSSRSPLPGGSKRSAGC